MGTTDKAMPHSANFGFLLDVDASLYAPAAQAERYLAEDPAVAIAKLRLFAERAAKAAAARLGFFVEEREEFVETLRTLAWRRSMDERMADMFHTLRKDGNKAVHSGEGGAADALRDLRFAHRIAEWVYRVALDPKFEAPPFAEPEAPRETAAKAAMELEAARKRIAALEAEMAAKGEAERFASELARLREAAPAIDTAESRDAAAKALDASIKMEYDEAETRELIDAQLREAGWDADTKAMRHSLGARPEKGRNKAIAEWPCEGKFADYVLFKGLEAIAIVEAKRASRNVPSVLDQAESYARLVSEGGWTVAGGDPERAGRWDGHRVPFVFATNGRPWLKQLAEASGVWFRDVRMKTSAARPLEGWYSPEGLSALLKIDVPEAERKLDDFGFELDFPLRYYQKDAILAVEKAIREGQRSVLLAMATGTGKTKNCIALLYRLLASGRFRRALFLVDRNALGEQAGDAFKETKIRGLRSFADDFGVKPAKEGAPDPETRVTISSVQAMARRILSGGGDAPGVDEYDLVVVDECHRGYLLDRELSDDELEFRSFEDYVSTYRRVLEHFDAVRVGLTATPAPHTIDIFGKPVYYYSYRQAVIDGYLVDHRPPVLIETKLSRDGIAWKAGESVSVYRGDRGQIELFETPDDLAFDVSEFNKRVVTREFNRVVCEYLAGAIDPEGERKTLVFCATDLHADMVVEELKKAFAAKYGEVPDEAVRKITGAATEPLTLIRRYKNERYPSVAVTVDLMTTGIDVPEICNLVFLRRVNSRILYEQMIGRATRLCEQIGKDYFEIYDAVDLYATMRDFTDMKPVVANPNIGFERLIREMIETDGKTPAELEAARRVSLDQLKAKLRRKIARMRDETAEVFETKTGMAPGEFADALAGMGHAEAAAFLGGMPDFGAWLDRLGTGTPGDLPISEHPDIVVGVRHKYFIADDAKDYLERFKAYLDSHENQLAALRAVTTKPSSLTRKDLKGLRLALDEAGFAESTLREAYREATNADVAASIIGYIRQQALGDPLVPWENRVNDALAKLKATKPFTSQQLQWLERIAKQMKVELVVDRAALDSGQFKADGGFNRINRVFDGTLERTLGDFADLIWKPGA